MLESFSEEELLGKLTASISKAKVLFNDFASSVIELAKSTGVKVGESVAESSEDGFATLQKLFSNSFSFDEQDIVSATSNAIKLVNKELSESKLNKMFLSLDIDTETFQDVSEAISSIATGDNAIKFSAFVATEKAKGEIKSLTESFKSIEDRVLSVSRKGQSALEGMISPLSDNRSYTTLDSALVSYRDEIEKTVFKTGLAKEEVQLLYSTMTGSGLNAEFIKNLSLQTVDGQKSISGLNAAMMIAKNTGLSFRETSEQLNTQLRTLGNSGKSATSVFEIMELVNRNTTLSMKEVNSAITSGQQKMKFWGDSTKESAAIFKGFLNTFENGRETLAAPLFDTVLSGIESMGIGIRGVIGMSAGLGGGPIGAGLRVEEALSSGEGITDVLEGVKNKIESFSGAEILTRKEAVDTGQEQQFEIQRRLLKVFLGVSGSQKQNLVLESFKKNDFGAVSESLEPTKGMTSGLAKENIALSTGAVGSVLNKLDVLSSSTMTGDLASTLMSSSKSLGQGASSFEKIADRLKDILNTESVSKLKELVSGTNKRKLEKEAADESKEFFSGELTSKTSLEELNSRERASDIGNEKLESFSTARDKLGLQSSTELDTFYNAREKLGLESSTELDTLYASKERLGQLDIGEVIKTALSKPAPSEVEVGKASPIELNVVFTAEMSEDSVVTFRPVIENIVGSVVDRKVEEKTGSQVE